LSRKAASHSPFSTSELGGVPEAGEMAARRSDAQNIAVLNGRVMPRGDTRNGNFSALGIPNPLSSSSQPTFRLLTDKPISQRVLPPSVFGFSNLSGSFGSDVADWPAALVGLAKSSAKSPAPVSGAGAPVAPTIPSNEFRSSNRRSFLGSASDASFPDTPSDLAGRFAASVGIDRTNPKPRAPQENGSYDGELPQPWLFRALTGRLR
jgi:hypothetical protein